jgi:hypothetical protein
VGSSPSTSTNLKLDNALIYVTITTMTNKIKNMERVSRILSNWRFTILYMEPFRTLRDKYDELCNCLFRRYDLIRTGLSKKDWHDKDITMLYGMMNLLVDYVDGEKCFEITKWDEDADSKRVAKEIKAIYRWWKLYDKLYAIAHNAKGEKFHKMQDSLIKEEQEMLIRLIKIRKYLWT